MALSRRIQFLRENGTIRQLPLLAAQRQRQTTRRSSDSGQTVKVTQGICETNGWVGSVRFHLEVGNRWTDLSGTAGQIEATRGYL
jgi:hypothetical protein